MEGQKLDAHASTPGRRVWKAPDDLSSTSWELINGVWVPTSFSVKHVVGVPGLDSLEIGLDLTMECLSVNPEYREDEFSLAKLDTLKGSHLIIDASRDPPLIVQKPGLLDTTTRWRMLKSVAPTERSLNIENYPEVPRPSAFRCGQTKSRVIQIGIESAEQKNKDIQGRTACTVA